MQIVINTEQPLSESDRAALMALIGVAQPLAADGADAAFDSNVDAGTIAIEPPEPTNVTPIKKTAAKKTAAKKTAAAKKAAPEPEEAPPAAEEIPEAPEPPEEAPKAEKMAEQAATMVRSLLADNKREKVLAVFADEGISKVADLAEDTDALHSLIVALGKIK